MRIRTLFPVGTAVALLLAGPAQAAEGEAAPEATEASEASEASEDTPQAGMRAFLTAARDADFEAAARRLDLRRLPQAERADRGPELAWQLKTVLDRKLWVELENISDRPEGEGDDGLPPSRERIGRIETASGPVEVLLERVRENGTFTWKVAAPTVARVPQLYDEFGYGSLGNVLPPVFFEEQLLEIQLWQWIGLLALLFAVWLASWVIVRVAVALLRPVVARSTTDLDDRLFESAVGPARLAAGVSLFTAGSYLLALSMPAQQFLNGTAQLAFIVAAAWFLVRLIDVVAGVAETRLQEHDQRAALQLVPLGRKTVKVFVVVLAVLAGLDSFGFDVTALIAGLGIGGLAVALALQKTLENLFGGATLLADRPVRVGDFCRFGDKVGTIEEIGLRSTRVRTLDRTLVTVPNAEFATLQLENFAKRDRIWYHPTIGLRYETTPEQIRYVLVEVRKMLYAHPKVNPDGARIRFKGFGASSLDLEIFSYVDVTDYGEFLEVAEDLNLRVMDIVEEAGSGFAFPSTTAYLAQDSGLDAERAGKAEAAVAQWREKGELYLPRFPQQQIDALQGRLDYPPEGSPMREGSD